MDQQDYVVIREGFVLRQLRQPGDVVRMHARQAQHVSNVMLKSQWKKLDAATRKKLADPHGDDIEDVAPVTADKENSA